MADLEIVKDKHCITPHALTSPPLALQKMSQPVKAGPRCPEDTPFKQQRLPAWQPILTPNWVIGTFLIVGCIFMPIGGAIYAASSGVTEIRVPYGDESACKSGLSTVVKIVPAKDMKNPFMYYELTNFYQNHRRYVTSRSDGQLRAAEQALESSVFDSAVKNVQINTCTPLICSGNAGANGCGTTTDSVKANGRWNLIYYPCGLIARSIFNDTFSMLRDESGANIALNKKKISWPSDIEKKFISPNAERIKPDATNLQGFISKHCGGFGDFCTLQDAAHPENRTIAQAACDLSGWCSTPIDPSKPDSGLFTVDILRNIAFNNQYVEGKTFCNSTIQPRSEQIYNCWHRCSPAGVLLPPHKLPCYSCIHSPTDEALIVWMRTAALPTFRRENLLLVSSRVFSRQQNST
jgi:hypothetical protein